MQYIFMLKIFANQFGILLANGQNCVANCSANPDIFHAVLHLTQDSQNVYKQFSDTSFSLADFTKNVLSLCSRG